MRIELRKSGGQGFAFGVEGDLDDLPEALARELLRARAEGRLEAASRMPERPQAVDAERVTLILREASTVERYVFSDAQEIPELLDLLDELWEVCRERG